MSNSFRDWALTKFSGCDNGNTEAGTPSVPSIWLLGIEHGTYRSIHDDTYHEADNDNTYSIDMQMKWPYNQKAFKLLASMNSKYGLEKYKDFAVQFQPFVNGSKGYFKGNLYPYPCHSQNSWAEKAITETGFSTKQEYLQWCDQHRLPLIRNWINQHGPALIIGVGIGHRDTFSKAAFGTNFPLQEVKILDDQKQRLFLAKKGNIKLVVIPHFSGRWGLNSNALIKHTGLIVSEFMSV